MRYPKFLPYGGTIGLVAPSLGCTTEPYKSAFDAALSTFAQMGYRTIEGPNCREDKGIGISNTPVLCAEELMDGYFDTRSDVLLSCGGGELMCEILPYLDFDRLSAAEPKWYMGYSDNTNFTFLSATLADTASIYGPCAPSFGMSVWHESLFDAFDLLCGRTDEVHNYRFWERESRKDKEHPLAPYHLTEPTVIRLFAEDHLWPNTAPQTLTPPNPAAPLGQIRSESAHLSDAAPEITMQGRLIGGCLDCLVNLVGTKFDRVRSFCDRYANDGLIWFLEACDLNLMGIRRGIWQLMQAGWFSHVKGFLIGRPLCFGEENFGIDQTRAVTDLLAPYHVPILLDVDIGHLPPMMPIVVGANASVHFADGRLSVRFLWT